MVRLPWETVRRWQPVILFNLLGLTAMAATVWILRSLRAAVVGGSFEAVDLPLMDWVHHHTPLALHNFLFFVTHVISVEVLVPALGSAVLLLLWRNKWREAAGLLSAALVPAILVPVSKLVFRQPRPVVPWALAHETSFSYPSGHAAFSLVLYGMAAYLIGQLCPRREARRAADLAAAALTLATGYSRVYLGVHYPSDILAGYAVGLVWLVASIAATEALHRLYPD